MKGVRLFRALVGALILAVLAGCGVTATQRAECEAWLEGLRPVYANSPARDAAASALIDEIRAGTLTGLAAAERLEAAEAEFAQVVAEIESLGQPPELVAARVEELRGGFDLVRRGFSLMAEAAREGYEASWDEGWSLLTDGVTSLNEGYVPYCGDT